MQPSFNKLKGSKVGNSGINFSTFLHNYAYKLGFVFAILGCVIHFVNHCVHALTVCAEINGILCRNSIFFSLTLGVTFWNTITIVRHSADAHQ